MSSMRTPKMVCRTRTKHFMILAYEKNQRITISREFSIGLLKIPNKQEFDRTLLKSSLIYKDGLHY